MMVYNFADHWDAFDNTEPLFNLGQWVHAWGVSTFEQIDSDDKNEHIHMEPALPCPIVFE
jgi:hypothetical protein